MPVVNTKGAASSQGFGEFAKTGAANYIEDVFSTYLYTGNGTTQTINNGIDLSTKGGLVWIKSRDNIVNHVLTNTIRGANKYLFSNTTAAENTSDPGTGITSFNTNGFSLGPSMTAATNTTGAVNVSWTFRKQPKFFDIVTFTGDGTDGRAISHSLGAVPGCIIMRKTSAVDDWYVYHRNGNNGTQTGLGLLNSSAAFDLTANTFGGPGPVSVFPTSTTFTIRNSINATGATYIAYIFAHNAGGFGLTGTDNVISCGSFTTDASGSATVNLGYEPQYILYKRTDGVGGWETYDTMRGWSEAGGFARLFPNTSDAEATYVTGPPGAPTATGFKFAGFLSINSNYIYIAIRRGPMKVPTTGTSVFAPITYTGNNTNPRLLDFSLNLDAAMFRKRNSAVDAENPFGARLLGSNTTNTTDTSAETPILINNWASNVGVSVKDDGKINGTSSFTYVSWGFKRAPSFMDVVCYTGTGANATWTHNLGVAPEMMLVKKRSAAANWAVYHSALTAAGYIILNTTAASSTASTFWQSTAPTSTSFYTGTNGNVGDSGATYVAYLFATCPGVSKVGSYTGTGATQTISCGFTGGARFVLVKRTDTTGDWYVWDTARGMVSGTDPSLLLNSTAAEVNANSIYTATGGFQIVSTAAGINASGGTYIYLAIA